MYQPFVAKRNTVTAKAVSMKAKTTKKSPRPVLPRKLSNSFKVGKSLYGDDIFAVQMFMLI